MVLQRAFVIAVAILFALFKVRPSPFCILDEVDAALDETNVERFLRVLREFTANTQFCIVTHHKRTMAECQALYGITMQKRGVSSRIAVALHEVDSFQADGPGPEPTNRITAPDPARRQRIARPSFAASLALRLGATAVQLSCSSAMITLPGSGGRR